MSTRSNIAIRLREEDRNKTFTTPWGEKVSARGCPFLYVYCHNDGYPSGVGADLHSMFDGGDYEEALEYILMGDRSTTDVSYWGWRREKCPPFPAKTEADCLEQEYLYIIMEENGELVVKQWTEYGYEGEEEYDESDLVDKAKDWFIDQVRYEATKDELQDIADCPVEAAEECAEFYDLNFENDTVRGVLCNTIGQFALDVLKEIEDDDDDE